MLSLYQMPFIINFWREALRAYGYVIYDDPLSQQEKWRLVENAKLLLMSKDVGSQSFLFGPFYNKRFSRTLLSRMCMRPYGVDHYIWRHPSHDDPPGVNINQRVKIVGSHFAHFSRNREIRRTMWRIEIKLDGYDVSQATQKTDFSSGTQTPTTSMWVIPGEWIRSVNESAARVNMKRIHGERQRIIQCPHCVR